MICDLPFLCYDDMQDIELCTDLFNFIKGLRTNAIKITTNAVKMQPINWFIPQPAFIKTLFSQRVWVV